MTTDIQTRTEVLSTMQPPDLEQTLCSLGTHGATMLHLGSAGWSCSTKILPHIAGTAIEIRSEFGHAMPGAAAQQCFIRLHDALKKLGKG